VATAAHKALAKRAGDSRGVLVAEGDSWFDYPFHDVLKELDDVFRWDVEQVAHRGDTVESMAYDGGQLDDFVRAIERVVRNGRSPHAILLSGGGNDVVGDWFGMLLDHRSSPTRGLNPGVVDAVVETRIGVAYTTILTAVTAACQGMLGAAVPILLHGYDYPVPDGRGFFGGWGPLPGPWMEPGFREKGYDDLGERVAIARNLIDRLYRMLDKVAAAPGFSHVRVVDLRGTLSNELSGNKYKASWDNELHPSADGFTEVARRFDGKL
jgi:lysophospholipase L1-like esterase